MNSEIEIPEGFTRWPGGECPADAKWKPTDVICRDGSSSVGEGDWTLGKDWCWEHGGGPEDIIAYRIRKPAQPEPTDGQFSAPSVSDARAAGDRDGVKAAGSQIVGYGAFDAEGKLIAYKREREGECQEPIYRAQQPAASSQPEEGELMLVAPGIKLPVWLLKAEERITAYMRKHHAGPWVLGGIQRREDSSQPPVAQGAVEALLRQFPLLNDDGLCEKEHHCEWAIQQERKRLHAAVRRLTPPRSDYQANSDAVFRDYILLGTGFMIDGVRVDPSRVTVLTDTPRSDAPASEKMCRKCGQPTMHMGSVCYACSHASDAPAGGGVAMPEPPKPAGGTLRCIWPDCGHDTNCTGYSPGCTGIGCPKPESAKPAGNAIDGLLATARPFLAEELLIKQGYTWSGSGWVAPAAKHEGETRDEKIARVRTGLREHAKRFRDPIELAQEIHGTAPRETVGNVESLASALATAHTQWGAKSSETRGSLYAHMAKAMFDRIERANSREAAALARLVPVAEIRKSPGNTGWNVLRWNIGLFPFLAKHPPGTQLYTLTPSTGTEESGDAS